MGVVYIGDRATGKTALAVELIDPKKGQVIIEGESYENLKRLLYDEEKEKFKGTNVDVNNVVHTYNLRVKVILPAGLADFPFIWIDTPGEIYNKSWPRENPKQWQKFLTNIQKSEGIILILPPYREMPYIPDHVDRDQFSTRQQWLNRFERWVDFFAYECPQVRHILLCLHKADLFTTDALLQSEAQALANKKWVERHEYIFYRYFGFAENQIKRLSRTSSAKVRCFITTIHHRNLLELPWFYLASHLSTNIRS